MQGSLYTGGAQHKCVLRGQTGVLAAHHSGAFAFAGITGMAQSPAVKGKQRDCRANRSGRSREEMRFLPALYLPTCAEAQLQAFCRAETLPITFQHILVGFCLDHLKQSFTAACCTSHPTSSSPNCSLALLVACCA